MHKLFFILFMIALNGYSQPGGKFGFYRMGETNRISESIRANPDDYELRWVRTELMFKPNLSLYTLPKHGDEESSDLELFQDINLTAYRNVDVLEDLNILINKNCTLHVDPIDYHYYSASKDGNGVTIADFLYKRGAYYYLKGHLDLAIGDFLAALNSYPSPFLKERICISIAAYHYNLDSIPRKDNLVKALEYIDLVTPIEYELNPRDLGDYRIRNNDVFEREKIALLKQTKNYVRLNNYLKNLGKSHFNLFLRQLEEQGGYEEGKSYSLDQSFENSMTYFKMLLENSAGRNEGDEFCAKLKFLIDQL